MNLNVASWLTETTLTPYPLVKSFGYDSFLIDANFIQFDNFVPTLKSITVTDSTLEITIAFDLVTKTITEDISNISTIGSSLAVYDNSRYLGTLVFGSGVQRFVDAVGNNTTLKPNISFLPHIVKSIPSKCGVFALNSLWGELTFASDEYISYLVTANDIVFNAVAYPESAEEPYLKTLNLIGPTNNSVFIKSSDLVKVTGQNSTVTISMVGNKLSDTMKSEAIIVTSDDNA
jgi:hypothetical protein